MNFPILSSITLLPILGSIFIFIFNNKSSDNKNVIYISLFTTIVQVEAKSKNLAAEQLYKQSIE